MMQSVARARPSRNDGHFESLQLFSVLRFLLFRIVLDVF